MLLSFKIGLNLQWIRLINLNVNAFVWLFLAPPVVLITKAGLKATMTAPKQIIPASPHNAEGTWSSGGLSHHIHQHPKKQMKSFNETEPTRGLIKYEKGFDISNTLKYSKHSFFFDKRRGTWRWLSSQLVKKQWSSGADDKQLGTLILTGFTAHCNREQSYLCPTRRQSPW